MVSSSTLDGLLAQFPRCDLARGGRPRDDRAVLQPWSSTCALTYGTTVLGPNRNVLLTAVMIAVAANAITIPFASAVSDRVGRKRVLIIGSIAIAAWAFPFFALFNTANYGLIVVAFVGLMTSYSFVYGPIAAFTSELFGTAVRFTGSALSYNLGGILGAAFAPILATLLHSTYGSSVPISIYIIITSAISLVCISLARETAKINMSEDRAHPVRIPVNVK